MARKKKPAEAPAWNPSKRVKAFLRAYVETGGNVSKAAAAAGISRSMHYRALERSKLYTAKFEEADREAADTLEAEAIRRAHDGVLKMKFYHGEPVLIPKKPGDPECKELVPYFEVEKSDALLTLLLKAKKPKQYRERIEHDASPELQKTLKFDGTFEELLAVYRDLTIKPLEGENE